MIRELTLIGVILMGVFWVQSKVDPRLLNSKLNEASVFASRAGTLLAKYGYIEVDQASMEFASLGLCSGQESLEKPYRLRRVKFYAYVFSNSNLDVNVSFLIAGEVIEKTIHIDAKRHLYSFEMQLPEVDLDEKIGISLEWEPQKTNPSIGSIGFINFAQKKYELIGLDGNLGNVLLGSPKNVTSADMVDGSFGYIGRKALGSELAFSFSFDDELAELLEPIKFPGLRNEGLCNYQVSEKRGLNFSKREWKNKDHVPIIDLSVTPRFLTGDKGITKYKKIKGRASEVPAKVSLSTVRGTKSQNVGLRFHGGVHRRKPNHLAGYRVYARPSYGSAEIGFPGDVFKGSDQSVKTLVLRSNQAYGHLAADYKNTQRGYNPYNHILSLEIGRKIGANVPRAQLVDFRLNGKKQDLYLALDHYSERYFNDKYPGSDISLYNYKKFNSPEVVSDYRSVRHHITSGVGERAYERFSEVFNVSQVINSILLSVYIGDDDYCQGVDVLIRDADGEIASIDTYNWDLDHGFMNFDLQDWYSYIDSSRFGFGLLTNRTGNCARQKIYKHVYQQSSIFRKALRDRAVELFDSELKEENLLQMLRKYQHIDWVYFDLKHGDLFGEFHLYFINRPNEVRRQLDVLERWVASRWRWMGE